MGVREGLYDGDQDAEKYCSGGLMNDAFQLQSSTRHFGSAKTGEERYSGCERKGTNNEIS